MNSISHDPTDHKDEKHRRFFGLKWKTLLKGILLLEVFTGKSWAGEANPCHMILPPVVYAVVGTEVNLYFQDLILSPPGRAWIFDVTCAKGVQQIERWTWVPKEEDVGEVPLEIEVRDADDKLVVKRQTAVRVVSAKAGSEQTVRLLCIGDSLTHASAYTGELMRLCAQMGQPNLKLLGTHHSSGAAEGNVHEGYGGWTFQNFVEKYTDKPVSGDQLQRSSPFVFGSPSGPVFDVPRYIKESCGGIPPDYITVFLGANDSGGVLRSSKNLSPDTDIERVLGYADKLIAGLRAAAPKAKIGLLPPLPPANQDAFGANYQCTVLKYWPYRKIQHRMVEMMMARYGHRESEGLFVISAFAMLDTEHGYPKGEVQPVNARSTEKVVRGVNAVHPSSCGYNQIADAIFSWLKVMVAQSKD